MSSEIYYDRAYIRVGDRFIPVVNHGSSNCFDFDACGREVPEKHWSVLNYTFHGRQLFTEWDENGSHHGGIQGVRQYRCCS